MESTFWFIGLLLLTATAVIAVKNRAMGWAYMIRMGWTGLLFAGYTLFWGLSHSQTGLAGQLPSGAVYPDVFLAVFGLLALGAAVPGVLAVFLPGVEKQRNKMFQYFAVIWPTVLTALFICAFLMNLLMGIYLLGFGLPFFVLGFLFAGNALLDPAVKNHKIALIVLGTLALLVLWALAGFYCWYATLQPLQNFDYTFILSYVITALPGGLHLLLLLPKRS